MKFPIAVDVLTEKVAELGRVVVQRAAPDAELARTKHQIAELNAAIAVLERAGARAEKTASKLRPRTSAAARGAVNPRGAPP